MDIKHIVDVDYPVSLVGAAPILPEVIMLAKSIAPVVIAADGGAAAALSLDWIPQAVIGDMDSLGAATMARLPEDTVHTVTEQDSTDFEKCLSRVSAPLIVGIGFLGGRIDHALACFHTLVQCAEKHCVLFDETDAVFLCPPEFEIDLPMGTRFSLFPMMPTSVCAQGLEWPFENLSMAPGRKIGTSNKVTGPVCVTTDAPGTLCIVPAREIRAVVRALLAAPQAWPVRSV